MVFGTVIEHAGSAGDDITGGEPEGVGGYITHVPPLQLVPPEGVGAYITHVPPLQLVPP